jgi:hypothetical protein
LATFWSLRREKCARALHWPPMSTEVSFDERQRRARHATRAIAAGAIGTASGIGVALLGLEGPGTVLTLGGALLLGWGLHRFGRLGADPPRWYGR